MAESPDVAELRGMRLSAADWCYNTGEQDPYTYYRALRELGYEAVEMAAPNRWEAARAAGLRLLNVSAPGMQDGLNQSRNHADLTAHIRRTVEECARAGISQLIIFSGNRGGLDESVGLRACIEACKNLAAHAERNRVLLTFEVLNSFDHADYMADHSSFGFDVVKAVSSPWLKLLFDVYHMHRMGEDVVTSMTRDLAFVGHIHVAGSPRRDFPGAAQQIDYSAVVRAASAGGYGGCWGMEFLPRQSALHELAEAAALFRSYRQAAQQ